MERISAAIDKARKERQAAATPGDDPARQAGRPIPDKDSAALSEIWQALPTFDVQPKVLTRSRILTYQAGPQATPFDVMRTKLLHQMRSNEWRRIAITSPSNECGKSTICLNLAFSLARQSDLRVMVIELDLRRPSISRMMRLSDGMNFAAVLAGDAPAAEHIKRHGSNLALATSQVTPNSAELLQGVTSAHVIDQIEARYRPDVMLFDMPPILVADDTMAFIDQVDATLLIAAAESSTLDEVTRCKQDLEAQTNLVGVVLNKCRYVEDIGNYDYGS